MTAKPWLVLQHVPYEGPGTIATVAAARGLTLQTVEAGTQRSFPPVNDVEGLIVMGGPASLTELDRHPNLAQEQDLLAAAVAAGRPVLGICLGAQLRAAALGGRVYRGPAPEIGFGWVYPLPAARRDPVFAREQDPLPVFHWHGDTFDLPPGAVWLARSDGYQRQAFRAGSKAYGLQFHVEVDSTLWQDWLPHLPAGVAEMAALARPGVELRGRRIIAAFFDAVG